MECVCVFISMYVHRKKILKDIAKIVYNIFLWQALISMICFLLCVSYFFYKKHTSVIQTSPVTWSRIPIWLWGSIYVIYCPPYLKIQQAKDWKYSREQLYNFSVLTLRRTDPPPCSRGFNKRAGCPENSCALNPWVNPLNGLNCVVLNRSFHFKPHQFS